MSAICRRSALGVPFFLETSKTMAALYRFFGWRLVAVSTFLAALTPPANHRYAFLASLTNAVRYILRLRPEKEMIWVNAGGNVTTMKDMQSLRDGSVMKVIRKAMRHPLFFVYNKVPIVPISTTSPTRPIPTSSVRFWRDLTVEGFQSCLQFPHGQDCKFSGSVPQL